MVEEYQFQVLVLDRVYRHVMVMPVRVVVKMREPAANLSQTTKIIEK